MREKIEVYINIRVNMDKVIVSIKTYIHYAGTENTNKFYVN